MFYGVFRCSVNILYIKRCCQRDVISKATKSLWCQLFIYKYIWRKKISRKAQEVYAKRDACIYYVWTIKSITNIYSSMSCNIFAFVIGIWWYLESSYSLFCEQWKIRKSFVSTIPGFLRSLLNHALIRIYSNYDSFTRPKWSKATVNFFPNMKQF